MLRIKQLLISAGLFLTLFTLPVSADTTKEICFSGTATIPNDDDNGVTTSISVGESGSISKIRLTQVNIKHNHIGEVSASLIHNGTTVHIGEDPGVLALTSDQGCKGQDIVNLTIADDGTKSIETDCLLAKPAYQSSAVHKPMGSFATFNGTDVIGTWSLKVADHHSFNTSDGTVNKWCLEYTRPTNTSITPTPAEGSINLGNAFYDTGVTQDIVIESNSGDDFEISRVEFVNVSSGASNDFIGSIKKEVPTASTLTTTLKPSSPYTSVITLVPNDRYRFSAQCKPTGTGTRSATFQMTTNLPAPNDVLSYPLTCDGNVALFSAKYNGSAISPGSTTEMGAVSLPNTLTNNKLVFENIGNQPLKLNMSAGTSDADVTIQNPSFPLTLAAGASQTIAIACTPTVAGIRSRQFTFTPDATTKTPSISSNVKYTFRCSGDAPVAKFTPTIDSANSFTNSFTNFTNAVAGVSDATGTIGIKNDNGSTATTDLSLSTAVITNDAAGAFSLGTTFPLTILKNSSKNISLTCKGTTLAAGTYTAKLTVNTNDTNVSSATFNLSCTVTEPKPVATLTPTATTPLNFNTVGSIGGELSIGITNSSSATKDLTVTSNGFSPATDAVAFELQDASNAVIAAGISISIGIGITQSIKVKCKGDAAPGTYSATLTLTTDDPTKPTITYPVNCTVADNDNHPLYTSNPIPSSTIDFGNVQFDSSSGLQAIQVSELGNASLKVDFDSISPDFFIDTSTTFPFTIANGAASVDVKIGCKPQSYGTRTGVLKLKATDISDNPVVATNYPTPSYNLSCKGTKPAYSSSPSSSTTINVGSVEIGSSISKSIDISNNGDAATTLSVSTATFTGAHPLDFTASGLPIHILQGATAKTMTVTCAPTGLGIRTATLEVKTNDPLQSTITYNLECTGQEAVGTVYSSDPAIIKDISNHWVGEIDFGNAPLNTTVLKKLKISESGTAVLNVGKPTAPTPFLTGSTSTIFVDDSLFNDPLAAIKPGFYISDGGATKEINITCQPTTVGIHTATLTLNNDDNDASKRTVTYTLKCNGVKASYNSTPAPSSTLNCGGTSSLIGTQLIETIKVEELGSVDLKLSSPSLSGTHASDFSIISPTFPVTLANGSSTATTQDIKIKFTPSAAGTRVAKLTLSTNDPDLPTVNYNLSCQAVAPSSPIVTYLLKVAVNPSQGGVVQDNLGQIHCGKGTTTCSGIFDINTAINLSTTAATGYQFKNWTGDCATDRVILNGDKTCVANFDAIPTPPPTEPTTEPTQPTEPSKPIDPVDPKPTTPTEPVKPTEPSTPTQPTPETPTTGTDYNISVTTTGKGTGKVTSAEMNCQNQQCNQTVAANTLITLVAQPVAGSTFLGWSGSCSGKTAIITVNITEHKQCIARFEPLATQPEIEDDGLGNYCTGVGYTNIRCNARGAVIADNNGKIEIDTDGYLSNGIITKPLTNKGWVANLTIEDTGSLEGGIVTGSIVNHGEMSNFEFRGDLLSGGKLSGVIKNNAPNVCFSDGIIHGVIKNVELAANTRILKGRLSGKIIGDAQQPAHLSHVILTGTTVLQNVILEESVIIEQDVTLETTQFVQVKLAPNVKISGGKIVGELHGDATAPAQLDNVLLSAHSTLENVIFGEKVEIADEKTCRSQSLADTEDQNSSETVAAILLTSDGKQQSSTTTFTPQLTTAQVQRENHSLLSQSEAATLNLSIQVTLQSEHLGKAADILVVAQYQLADKTEYYMKTAQGWKIWKGQLSDLQPLQSYEKLPPLFDISVFNGDLSQTEGELNIYTGYRLPSGDIIFNGLNPLHFAISSPTKSCSLTCGCQ